MSIDALKVSFKKEFPNRRLEYPPISFVSKPASRFSQEEQRLQQLREEKLAVRVLLKKISLHRSEYQTVNASQQQVVECWKEFHREMSLEFQRIIDIEVCGCILPSLISSVFLLTQSTFPATAKHQCEPSCNSGQSFIRYSEHQRAAKSPQGDQLAL